MQLAKSTTNIIESVTQNKHNIIWRPSGGLNDCSFFESNFRYYLQPIQNPVFTNPSSRTAVTLKEPFFNDNTYGLIVTNDINDATPKESLYRHINNVVIFNTIRPPNMKREDFIITEKKNTKRTKLFMTDDIAASWEMPNNSVVVNYGVPLDILTTEDIEQSGDLLIHDTSMLGKQLMAAAQQKGLKVELVTQFTNFTDFSEKVKKYKVYLDTTLNGNYECLCAVACGAKVVGTRSCKKTAPGITIENNGGNLLNVIEQLLSSDSLDVKEGRDYLEEHYNFLNFKNTVTELFTKKIQEAYIA